jgi:hypothetical protein
VCEIRSFILREEHELRLFENRALREEVAGGCRRLHNEELHDLYASPNVIRVIRSKIKWVGHVARMGEMRNAYNISVRKPERKEPHGRAGRTWENNIKKDFNELVLYKCVNWIHLLQGRN